MLAAPLPKSPQRPTAMRKGRIFISYRRDDAAGYARAVYDELVRHFSDERVFMDVDDIAAGLAFDEVIRREVGQSQVLLVLVGSRFLGEHDGLPARIADPKDFVRLEIEAALASGHRIMPVLLDGAPMPGEDQLPESLCPLARRNALELSNTRFAADTQRLVAAVREALGEKPPPAGRASPAWHWKRTLLVAAATGLAAGLLVGLVTFFGPGWDRPDINGDWVADVNYDWPGARHTERFIFTGEAGDLQGSASFLGVPRGIVEGSAEAGAIRFTTRSSEVAGGATVEQVHRYRGTPTGRDIRFVMQTEGGGSAHVPIEFIAKRRTTP
jgi:hypothetical protein